MQPCRECARVLALSEFYKDRSRPSGVRSICRDCSKAYSLEWYRTHPRRDPAKNREALRRFRERHPDKDREYGRRWREKDPERARGLAYARHLKFRAERPERHAASEMRRRAASNGMTREDEDYMAILRRDPCSYCGSDGGTVDHIAALFAGGNHNWQNLTSACRRCNTSKYTDDLLSFLLRKSAQPT